MKMIKAINQFFFVLFNNIKTRVTLEQKQLIVFICIPCLSITTFSLYIANISGYLIAFILIILLLLSSYFFVTSKQQAEHQIRTLSNIVEAMIQGDYSLKGRLHSNKAFDELLLLTNNLSDTLSRHKAEAKESRALLEKIMVSNTSIEALKHCQKQGIDLAGLVCEKALKVARKIVPSSVELEVWAVDRKGTIVANAFEKKATA